MGGSFLSIEYLIFLLNLYFQEGTLDEHVAIFPSSHFQSVKRFCEHSVHIASYEDKTMSLKKCIKELDNKAAVAKSDDPDDSKEETPTVTPSVEVNTVTPSVEVNDKLLEAKKKLNVLKKNLHIVNTKASNIL